MSYRMQQTYMQMCSSCGLVSSWHETHSHIVVKGAPCRFGLSVCVFEIWDSCIPATPDSLFSNSYWPIVLGLFSLLSLPLALHGLWAPTHLARTEVLLGHFLCRTHTHTQIDPHLSLFVDHFTGQSPYPSLRGHCGPALSWERSFIHRGKPLLLCLLPFSEWRKPSHTACAVGGHI